MPILVKDFTWTQTMDTLHIRIPISPVYKEEVDIFTFESYVKVHFSPFLFEVFLLHDVDESKSKCLVKEDIILLDLIKVESCNWESLEKQLTKPEKMKYKHEVLERSQAKAKQEAEDKHIKKTQLDRFTVQRAMEIDTKQHNLMDSRRDDERKKAMDSLEDWRVNTENQKSNLPSMNSSHVNININKRDLPSMNSSHVNININKRDSGVKIVELPSDDEEEKKTKPPAKKENKKHDTKPVKTPVRSEYVEKKKEEVAKRVLPKLRAAGELIITHTPRTFPTPSRESTAMEEETWLKNVTLARRATGFVSEDLRPEEQDPQWCKEKGDEFFRNGNFLGAVSAYTHGITLSDKLPSLFANRAATHFALGNFNKCLNDCSTALDLLKPPCEGNRRSRAKCMARRAAALVRVGYLSKGIDEMKAAVKLLPEDENIKKDLYDMERAWEQNPDSD